MAQKSKPLDRQPRSRNKAATPAGDAVMAEVVSHPEEMRASGEIQFGNLTLKGSARVTPAGLICAGIAGVTVLLATAALMRAARR